MRKLILAGILATSVIGGNLVSPPSASAENNTQVKHLFQQLMPL